jgi:hypothetical protein
MQPAIVLKIENRARADLVNSKIIQPDPISSFWIGETIAMLTPLADPISCEPSGRLRGVANWVSC